MTTLLSITRARIAGNLALVTSLSEQGVSSELLRAGISKVWVTMQLREIRGGFTISVLRPHPAGGLHLVGTMKVLTEEPPKTVFSIQRAAMDLDLPRAYVLLGGTRGENLGFEAHPPSWFEGLFRNRLAIRHFRQELIRVLYVIVHRRTNR